MALLDRINRITCRFHQNVQGACLGEKDVEAARVAATAAFPKQIVWHPLRYPGEFCLPVFLMPLAAPAGEKVGVAVNELHAAMQREGFTQGQCQTGGRYERRQAHLWLAMLSRRRYLPIGQAVFSHEECRSEAVGGGGSESVDEPPAEPGPLRLKTSAPPETSRRWWLRSVWLSPAYRCQRIFRHTVPYFAGWHPGFQVREPAPMLARALKDHPAHIFEAVVSWF